METAARYPAARSKNPSGGVGSCIRRSTRPWSARAFMYRLSGRWTNGRNTPLSTSSNSIDSTR